MKLLTLALLLTTFIAPLAWAQTPSQHPTKAVEQKRKATEDKKKQLQKDLKSIKNDLEAQRKKSIAIAKDIKRNEQSLSNLERDIAKQQADQKQIEDNLSEDKKSISQLVLALERIRRIPPEAIISRPETPLKTAQGSMLLQSILPRIYNRADKLKEDLETLETLITSLEKDRAQALSLSTKLKKDQKQLTALLSSRESIYAKTEKDIKNQQAELKQISLQAKNLKDLVKKIEKSKQQKKKAPTTTQAPKPRTTPIPKLGAAQLPASGTMLISYGKTDGIGAISKGIKIKTRPNALIVAPMGGVVEYAGTFKGYGNIVILKHQKQYHSLIAGLAQIDALVGRSVAAGEPIGKMSGNNSDSGDNRTTHTLYYELRYKGQPVNPSKKISGLR